MVGYGSYGWNIFIPFRMHSTMGALVNAVIRVWLPLKSEKPVHLAD
jgi:hypothetical protein